MGLIIILLLLLLLNVFSRRRTTKPRPTTTEIGTQTPCLPLFHQEDDWGNWREDEPAPLEPQHDEPAPPEPQHDEPAPPEPQPLYHTYPIEHRSGDSNSTISIPEDAILFTAPGYIELYPPTGDQRNTIPIKFVSSAQPPEFLQNSEIIDYRFHYQVMFTNKPSKH